MASTYMAVWFNRVDADFLNTSALDQASRFARKAVELDPNLPEAHAQLGYYLVAQRELEASIAAFERASALNPNFVSWQVGYALVRAGDSRRAIDVLNSYMRLDPFHTPFASGLLGFAHYMLKQYAQALPLLRDCVFRSPNLRSGHIILAATYVQMGELEEARAVAAEVMRLEPNYTISGIARRTMTFKNAEDDQHFFDGLRKAGLPSSFAHSI